MTGRADCIVIGAGAAGLLAATRAAQRGLSVLLLEKNRKPGVKILMSGGTRCNLTHATNRRGIAEAFGKQGRFLHSALAALGPDELVALFNAAGIETKVEATGKVFPASDRALDVQRALIKMLKASGAELRLAEPATSLDKEGELFLVQTDRGSWQAASVLITSGGQSYPGCGTTGDGYAWAKYFGHRIVPPRPALVPLLTNAEWIKQLQGVTIPDTEVSIGLAGEKPTARRRGSLLMTHFGLSGPVAMDISRVVTERPAADDWEVTIDFAPTLNDESILAELSGDAGAGRRRVLAVVDQLAPRRLAETLIESAKTPTDRRLAELSKPERRRLVDAVKRSRAPITGTQGFKKAEVTAGGVDLQEIDSRTLQSKLVEGLYFAGEVLDLDGPIGGYNFQAAFSTGWLAGESVSPARRAD